MEFHPVVNSDPKDSSSLPTLKEINLNCPDDIYRGVNSYISGPPLPSPCVSSSIAPSSIPAVHQALSSFHLSSAQVRQFRRDGVLIVRKEEIWNEDELQLLLNSSNDIDQWNDAPGKYMKYYENSKITNEKILCRIENFCQYSPGLNYFCNGSKLVNACSDLFGEKSLLYKEKINYKLPGGAGFVCHQDVAAGWWMYGQSLHISVLVGIDRATIENGCLEVALGQHQKGMLADPWKEIPKEVEDTLTFIPVPTEPGDVIFFDSYVPHRSAPNATQSPRRVLYSTYAKQAEGDYRTKYYADKRLSYPPDCERLAGKNYEYKV